MRWGARRTQKDQMKGRKPLIRGARVCALILEDCSLWSHAMLVVRCEIETVSYDIVGLVHNRWRTWAVYFELRDKLKIEIVRNVSSCSS